MVRHRLQFAKVVAKGMRPRTWLVSALVTVVLVLNSCFEERGLIPLILDHDGAPDDYIALLMLAGSRCCDLRGVTVSYGLGYRDTAVETSGLLLEAMGLDVPVAGHDPAMRGPNSFPETWRDTSSHIRTLPMLQGLDVQSTRRDAVALLMDLLENAKQPLTIVATGPLTNIAAVFNRRPDLFGKVERLVVMGGALRVPGNVRRPEKHEAVSTAEYNFFVDPVGADRVIAMADRGLDITIVPLDVTNDLPLDRAWLDSLRRAGSFGTQLAAGILGAVEQQIEAGRYYLWDGAAVMALLYPEGLRFETDSLRVVTTGGDQGRLRTDNSRTARVKIATGLADETQPLDRALEWFTNVPRQR